jgi:hypothetical protein
MKNYLQRVDVINFILSNMKNISRGKIRCPYMKCKNKKLHHNDVVMMHLLKIVCRKIFVMVCTSKKPYVPYKNMLDRMICSTFSSNNIHEFVNDNSNLYRSMVMNTMRMNQGYSGEGLFNIFLDEKSNIDATRFFKFLKDYDEPL